MCCYIHYLFYSAYIFILKNIYLLSIRRYTTASLPPGTVNLCCLVTTLRLSCVYAFLTMHCPAMCPHHMAMCPRHMAMCQYHALPRDVSPSHGDVSPSHGDVSVPCTAPRCVPVTWHIYLLCPGSRVLLLTVVERGTSSCGDHHYLGVVTTTIWVW